MKIKRRNYRLIRLNMVFGTIVGMTLGSFMIVPEGMVSATGSETSVNVALDPTISLATDDSSVAFELDPGTGALSTASTGVLVNTNSSTGYTVYVASESEETALVPGSSEISTQIPTLSSTVAEGSFPVNHWGYYNVDSGLFNGVPASGSQTAILHKSTDPASWVAPEDEESVKFNLTVGARVNTEVVSGSYSNTIVLTAVAND